MASWAEFRRGDPGLAALAQSRVEADGLVLVGTLRANGWPRISPVEPLIVGDDLLLGMMWRSRKALDLLADPRCVVHSTVHDRAGTQGDVKVYGLARDIDEPAVRARYGSALEAAVGWRPDGDFHLFAVDLTEVGYFAVVDGGHDVRTWRPGPPCTARYPTSGAGRHLSNAPGRARMSGPCIPPS